MIGIIIIKKNWEKKKRTRKLMEISLSVYPLFYINEKKKMLLCYSYIWYRNVHLVNSVISILIYNCFDDINLWKCSFNSKSLVILKP